MKTIIKLLATTLLLSTLLLGNSTDHTSSKYKLLNDLTLANKQHDYIDNMSRILKFNIKDRENYNTSKNLFEKVLKGLVFGDKALNLRGTNIKNIRVELDTIQQLWDKEKQSLEMALSDKKSRLKAIDTIAKINIHMKRVVKIYNKSYARYKQGSKLSFIVHRHSNSNKLLAMK